MKKKIAAIIAAFALLFVSCSAPNMNVLPSIDVLKHETNGFIFPGIAWGISPEELDALPGYSLGHFSSALSSEDPSTRYATYESDQSVEIMGKHAYPTFQFLQQKLVGVGMTFAPMADDRTDSDLAELFDAAMAQAEAAFGAPYTATKRNAIEANGWMCEVESGRTMLGISKSLSPATGAIRSVSIGVGYLDTTDQPISE